MMTYDDIQCIVCILLINYSNCLIAATLAETKWSVSSCGGMSNYSQCTTV